MVQTVATAEQNERFIMNNPKIRRKMASNMLPLYHLDKILGISEATRCRMLRNELPEAEQDRICHLIDEYIEKRGEQDYE